jgi:1A family penicillin-binding protein
MPIPQLSKKPKPQQSWRNMNQTQHFSMANRHKPLSSLHVRMSRGRNRYSRQFITNAIYVGLIGCMALALFGFVYVLIVSRDLPDPNRLIDRDVAESTKIYDRTGETILYDIHGVEQRTIVNIAELPDYVKWATITAEDRTFYEHHGFNILGILRGVLIDPFRKGYATGGSTLTQQLVKNAILTDERSVSRKIKEFVLSYRIENKFSKDEILQMYFNEIPYGSTAYGVEAAARRYFNTSAKDLNLAQATILAALPQRPSYLSPYGSHVDELFARQKWILDNMENLKYITAEQKKDALGFKIEFRDIANTSIIAPHFVMYVKELLSEKYGDAVIESEGLRIYTTLDLYKQNIAEEVVKNHGEKNIASYNANNAALLSLDPKTGQILAMVGSRDYRNDDIDGQVNVTIQPLQPGSSFKPIVYAVAFDKGYTPNTILYDVVTNFAVDGATPYEPHNYDLKEHGPVSIRAALAGSLNVPAVKALYLAGVQNVIDYAHRMGYTTLNDPERYGLSLVLGGGEVKLLDHTAAYGVFAREGEYHPPVAILKIEDRNGKILEEYKDDKKEVLNKETARKINNILSDNDARAFVFGANNWLTLPGRPVAAKTGTTNDYKDAWTIGYTPSIVTGVWVGNTNGAEMKRGADGSKIAAPIWNEYMRHVLGNTPVEAFQEPQKEEAGKAVLDGTSPGETMVKIDSVSGLLANENTPPELIVEKTFQEPHSILYYVNPADPRGPEPKAEERDVQFKPWEDAIQMWAEREKITVNAAPAAYDNVHDSANKPNISLTAPGRNAVVTSSILTASVSVSAPQSVSRVEYFIDNSFIDMNNHAPYNLSLPINYLSDGGHTLKARACDIFENCGEDTLQFNLILPESERDTSVSFAWVSPNDSIVRKTDFPLQLKTLTYQPQGIKSVAFYALKLGADSPQAIASVSSISGNEIIASWQNVPEVGVYKIFAEALGANNSRRKTDLIYITITE